uniref:Rab-GAP TBC domain-containing protein n=1 Tax=Schistocephalus solidus TaxID=70667 RepID=A0A183TU34_SCHSO
LPFIFMRLGMSNLASPLLFVQDNEGAAYICFCALMQRLGKTFCPQNQLLTLVQMQHLHDLLVFTDWELAQFLRLHNLGNMFFTERWLLLELVREFAFEDALYVLEVQWASLNLIASQAGLPEQPASSSTSRDYFVLSEDAASVFLAPKPLPTPAYGKTTAAYCPSDLKLINNLIGTEFTYTPPSPFSHHTGIDTNLAPSEDSLSDQLDQTSKSSGVPNGVQNRTSAIEQRGRRWSSTNEGDPIHMKDWVVELPPPDQLGRGNPFLLFICVSMLLEYRERILTEVNEASDLFHIFQQMTRQHNHISIVNRARALFDAYLRNQEDKRHKMAEQAELALLR